jgi:hypothetical protein
MSGPMKGTYEWTKSVDPPVDRRRPTSGPTSGPDQFPNIVTNQHSDIFTEQFPDE